MPADLSITSVGNAPAESPAVPARDTSGTTSPVSASAAPGPNPVRYFDTASGIVVLEFVSANGNVANTIPTEKQLEAFRRSHDQPAAPVDPVPSTLPASQPTTGGSDASQAAVLSQAAVISQVTAVSQVTVVSQPSMEASGAAATTPPPATPKT